MACRQEICCPPESAAWYNGTIGSHGRAGPVCTLLRAVHIIIIIIIIQDLYSANSLRSTLQYKGRQNSYNTIKYKRIKRALLRRAYNLIGWGRWYKRL